MIRALIFDFDGLIIDTESAIYQAWQELYADHGHPLPVERWAQCVGTDFGAYNPKKELELLTGKDFDWHNEEALRTTRVHELLATFDALPGVREMLSEAKAAGIPCSIASSSPRSWIEPWLDQMKLREFFVNISSRDVVEKIKPAPDLFLHAAAKLGAQPEEVVIFEDSLNGLRAAQAAGMKCVVVPGPVTRHLHFEGAWQMHESLASLTLAQLMRS
ncbi:MAG: family hydrolase [Verrucomicrobiaceae bacterium]|nr:family hydrolase [Verrucomicrobiaceae bacterium]